jgi:protein-disulfide isomerase
MLVNKYVKAGKLRIEFRNFAILGPDSQTAARALEAAAKTNRAWQFIDLWYQNQGDEKTPYVTDAFITRIATGAGIAPVPIVKASHSGGIPPSAATANTEASKFGFNSTPSFLVGKTGQANQTLQVNDPSDPSGFTQAIDTALGGP